MFTGIIETLGEVVASSKIGGDVRLGVNAADFSNKDVAIGDSIAVNGVCLTVVVIEQSRFSFDVSLESIQHSLIGEWGIGTKVNLEMALLPTTRLGGHLVSGHVDGLATLKGVHEDARSRRMVFELPAKLAKYVAKKGSITIDGVSLTVNSVDNNMFDINVIPHTYSVTSLGSLKVGSQVHIEVDLIARYLERLLKSGSDDEENKISSNLTESFLQNHGFS
jgi:riboflavin synthase